MKYVPIEYIAVEDLKLGAAYEVKARNFEVAIWNGERFCGLRNKFGNNFMDTELHWDEGAPHGTVKPIKELK